MGIKHAIVPTVTNGTYAATGAMSPKIIIPDVFKTKRTVRIMIKNKKAEKETRCFFAIEMSALQVTKA